MPSSATAPVEDHSELRSRVQSVEIGSRLKLVAAVAALAYGVATWGAPHRHLLVALLVAGAGWALAPLAVGTERIVRSAHREAFFLARRVSSGSNKPSGSSG